MKAMIMAAGLGIRLHPYTHYRPKPLFPVLGKPLIRHTIAQLRRNGFESMIVNAHHLREQFVPLLKSEPNLYLQLEDRVLGTGGGLRLALSELGKGPVLIVNGDLYHNLDLGDIVRRHRASGAQISLVVHDHQRFQNVMINARNEIVGIRGFTPEGLSSGENRLTAFTGIQVVESDLLRGIPAGEFYDIIDLYISLIKAGGRIVVLPVSNHFWIDMGTPADYLALHRELLAGGLPTLELEDGLVSQGQYFGPRVKLGHKVRFSDWVSIGADVVIGDRSVIARSVVWDGAVIPAGSLIEDKIVVR
ncbi:MAG: NDP-sugar synthase [Proteobacteria bacterium]|nr:NDP-sugar synthase [Pseudomonadota bacterium]MBU1688872.1 NDP-sugar synthase [Pseudomonadota bacterium]